MNRRELLKAGLALPFAGVVGAQVAGVVGAQVAGIECGRWPEGVKFHDNDEIFFDGIRMMIDREGDGARLLVSPDLAQLFTANALAKSNVIYESEGVHIGLAAGGIPIPLIFFHGCLVEIDDSVPAGAVVVCGRDGWLHLKNRELEQNPEVQKWLREVENRVNMNKAGNGR